VGDLSKQLANICFGRTTRRLPDIMTTTQHSKPINPESNNSSEDLWVFGYGSLMWRPGFDFREKHIAHVQNFHRSLCILSHVHRGTVEKPGLVLGLDRGGSCTGISFRVDAHLRDETLSYLRAREQATNVYIETWLPVQMNGQSDVSALTYIVNTSHHQYCGTLSEQEKIELIRDGHGISGANPDYVRSTYLHLKKMGIEDAEMARLVEAL
jgi:cation transport protein ChaC